MNIYAQGIGLVVINILALVGLVFLLVFKKKRKIKIPTLQIVIGIIIVCLLLAIIVAHLFVMKI